jgi:gluconolactonase
MSGMTTLLPAGLARCVLVLCVVLAADCVAVAQQFARTEIMEVARGLRFTDGPAWSPEGFLVFLDVPNNRLLRYDPQGRVSLLRDNVNGASGAAFDKSGNLFLAESVSRRLSKWEKGKPQPEAVAASFEEGSFNSPNDLVVRRNGDIYFTDPAFGSARNEQELKFHGLFRLSSRGEVTVVKRSETRLNGIALSPDHNTLYVTDSDRRVVLAMDVNNRGDVRNERELVAVKEGIPAGLCVDTKGNLYVAADFIRIYDSGGKSLGLYRTPEKPSNCVFGEADGKALYVTSVTTVHRIESEIPGTLPR